MEQHSTNHPVTSQEDLKLLAGDLTKKFPRSPRETLAGYVIAARTVDKCRAVRAAEGRRGGAASSQQVDALRPAYDRRGTLRHERSPRRPRNK
jgi:hypothetical protein